ncbi:MAG TPA: hypothetical protein VN023_09520 [Methylovorus sp.]|nr:hypothetical protein [Methylovorus sp.]
MADGQAVPADYKSVFENTNSGQKILDDLVVRFHRNPFVKGGHEADRQTAYNAGCNAVVDHILLRINQANGVNDNVQQTDET